MPGARPPRLTELHPQVTSIGALDDAETEALVAVLVPGKLHPPPGMINPRHPRQRKDERMLPANGIVRAIRGVEDVDEQVAEIMEPCSRRGLVRLRDEVRPADE